jgi:hypothetical protein
MGRGFQAGDYEAVDPKLADGRSVGEGVIVVNHAFMRTVFGGANVLGVPTLTVLVLSAALGADPGQIFRSLFTRALVQMAIGAAVGVAVAAFLELATDGGLMNGHGALVLPVVALLMMLVGLVAVLGPARRGLRIQPTEALRAE